MLARPVTGDLLYDSGWQWLQDNASMYLTVCKGLVSCSPYEPAQGHPVMASRMLRPIAILKPRRP